MAVELEQFHEVFFEESLEGLDTMEDSLLSIGGASADSETINTIFRSAHSIKGGSGTFGFTDVTDFTHVMETLLDEVRDNKRQLDESLIELLLQSCDCLRGMIATLQSGGEVDNGQSSLLIQQFEALLNIDSTHQPKPIEKTDTNIVNNPQDMLMDSINTLLTDVDCEENSNTQQSQPADNENDYKIWRIVFKPEPQILLTANEPLRIFRELANLGSLKTITAYTENIPDFHSLAPDECHMHWALELESDTNSQAIEEVFDWVIDECELTITQPQQKQQTIEDAPTVIKDTTPSEVAADSTSQAPKPSQPAKNETPAETTVNTNTSSSIRVGIDKVDNLINLVGELVITQSMLSELGNNFEMDKIERLSNGLEQLLQNTKELQESVMRIRMLPISFAFNRFPRMIRDLATKTGKQVELQIHGENTELDKTVMEQISDPLVHLVRNAIDHGIEPAEVRQQSGKPEQGVIGLDAYHQGGNIVIEITDDGKGIDRTTVLNKAVEKGLIEKADCSEMTDSDAFDLLFAPGFSTAAVVSDISGRGVGMDVVKRNIKALGGRIQIESELGKGSTFRIHLPLTLAILDGQLVRVGQETYVIPLISIVESLQIKPDLVNHVSGNMVLYRLREDNVPIIPIYQQFNIEADTTELDNALLVVVETEGEKVGLLVDDLLAQQQVVIKNLQDNFQQVPGISGATILGDGSVAMILDIAGLINCTSNRTGYNSTQAA